MDSRSERLSKGRWASPFGGGQVICTGRDSRRLARAVRRLVTDPALRARLEAGAAALTAEFAWERIARDTVAFFGRL